MAQQHELVSTALHCTVYYYTSQNTYLPTMPEDILPHVRQVLNSQAEPQGQFYGTVRM